MNSQNYFCLQKNIFEYKNYSLVPIRIQDAESIRIWRNQQINVLRQDSPISSDQQKMYFKEVIQPLFNQKEPPLLLFSFLEKSDFIGYGGFVHIDWNKKTAEISFLVETKRSKDSTLYRNDFTSFLFLLKRIACDDLKFSKLFTETYDLRPIHNEVIKNSEFKLENIHKGGKIIDGKSVDILSHSYICKN
jgi:hypothetical protein